MDTFESCPKCTAESSKFESPNESRKYLTKESINTDNYNSSLKFDKQICDVALITNEYQKLKKKDETISLTNKYILEITPSSTVLNEYTINNYHYLDSTNIGNEIKRKDVEFLATLGKILLIFPCFGIFSYLITQK